MLSFLDLKKNLKKDFQKLKSIKIAVLADSATQLYVQSLRGYAYNEDLNLEISEADYNQIDLQLFDSSSELYAYKPEFVVIFQSTQHLLKAFYATDQTGKKEFADHHLKYVQELINAISGNINAKIIYFNFAEINDAVFGNYSNKMSSSLIYQVRKINYELMNLAEKNKNFFINDVAMLQNHYGCGYVTDPKIYINTDIIFSMDFLPVVAKNTVDIIQSILGKFKKCLILDLDNTLWGGIIGDDGVENIHIGDLGIGKAFTELQLWIKQLKQRGIIIAICSKNTEEIAKQPFETHPDMVLKLDDIAVFVANWETKVDNIHYIQSILNIGFDSMVFLDDNPFERNIVRQYIPEITVPELPVDPADYLPYLRTLNLFETSSFTEEDTLRTKQYQEEANRVVLQKSFTNQEEFLKSLNMVSAIQSFNKFNIPRVAQLSQRSNQFNLRTIRYTEEDIAKFSTSDDHITLSFALEDKYGDYGLISIIILEKKDNNTFFIDSWIMSCRVLKRGMEAFTLDHIINIAKEQGIKKITGQYIPTAKNQLVKEHYRELGFKAQGEFWELLISDYKSKKVYIEKKL
jgi:FkbH-like protein